MAANSQAHHVHAGRSEFSDSPHAGAGWPPVGKATTAVPPIAPLAESSAEPTASALKNPSVWIVRDPPTGMESATCDWNPSGPSESLHGFPLSSQNLSVKLTGAESI